MRSKIKKTAVTITMAAALIFAAGFAAAWDEPAFAADQAALDVYYDDTCLKSFSMSELQSIAAREGSKKYTYSGFNTYPTPELFENVEGPTVAGVLDEALRADGRSLDQIGDLQIISFRAYDGVKEEFLKGSILSERYYYPDFELEKGREGQAVLPGSLADKEAVPAVISLRENGVSYPDSREVGRLVFGQKVPNEQNHSMFVKYMATKDAENPGSRGRITICSESVRTVTALEPIRTAEVGIDAESGTQVITFDRSVNASHTESGARYWIYYTTDGSEPDALSEMYNYNNYKFGQDGEKFNKPALPGTDQPLRVKVTGYSRTDSSVSTFCFPGKTALKPLILKNKTAVLKWKAAASADGYQIWRAAKKSGEYKLVKTVKSGKAGTFKNKGLKKGKTYYYKIRAFRVNEGNTGYGSFSAVKNIKVK